MRLARPLWSCGLALALLVNAPLYAKSASGSGGGSFSKPSASSSFSKPSPSPHFSKPALSSPSSSSSFSKPSTASQPSRSLPTPAPRSVDSTIAKGQSQQAYRQFQAEQQKYRAPPAAAPQDSRSARQTPAWRQYGTRWRSADSYYTARENALRASPGLRIYYEHPPVYVLAGRPSYGAYAGAFLGGALLDHIAEGAYARWAYSHYGDPGFQAWYADMQHQAADNAELRAKMAQLDEQVKQLKAQNAPVTEALPDDVDPSLVVAPQTVMLATAHTNWWLWSLLIVLSLLVAFFVACVVISKRRNLI